MCSYIYTRSGYKISISLRRWIQLSLLYFNARVLLRIWLVLPLEPFLAMNVCLHHRLFTDFMSLCEHVSVRNNELTVLHENWWSRIRRYNMIHESGSGWYFLTIAPLRISIIVLLILNLLEQLCAIPDRTMVLFFARMNLANIVYLIAVRKVFVWDSRAWIVSVNNWVRWKE